MTRKKKTLDLDNIRASIEERYGKDVIGENYGGVITALPTGILSLDICTGIGGFPMGRFSQIWGDEMLGKTTLALHAAGYCLAHGGKVAFIDMERTTDTQYARFVIGADIFDPNQHNYIYLTPDNTEQGLTLAEQLIQIGEFDLVIYDSLGGSASVKVHEKELTDRHVGLLSEILSKFIPRISKSLLLRKTAFIFINQYRDKIDARFGGKKFPGGNALEHALSLDICLTHGTLDKNAEKEVIARRSHFIIKKNKCAIPFKQASFPTSYTTGKIDVVRDTLEFAKEWGVCTQRGAYYYYVDKGTSETLKLGQGMQRSVAFLEENELLLDTIKKMCYNLLVEIEPTLFNKLQKGKEKED